MICREWQRRIPDFLDDKMTPEDLGAFISHVKECRDCYEELEIMFTLSVGLNELEKKTDMSFNFKEMLEEKIHFAQYRYECYYHFYKIKGFIMLFMHMIIISGMILQLLAWVR